ncbi:MAG TPA: NAD(P)H-hydrate dehydratase [Chloroflexota bacterium]|nr:NAD(P)H-hydrate dehydratase [Chloroflexota bacterium]
MSLPLVTAEEMRAIETRYREAGGSLDELMRRAGEAVSRIIAPDARVLILAGPGNNGGDALVAAERLRTRGQRVAVYAYNRRDQSGTDLTADGDSEQAELRRLARGSTVIVDGLLGTGRRRPVEGTLQAIIETVNQVESASRLAIDIPTGVDADTGQVESVAFRAALTLTLGFAKRGLWSYPGREYAGSVRVIDIGLPAEEQQPCETRLVTEGDVARLLPRRAFDSNKGRNGTVAVVAGSRDFTGAPVMVAMAAYRIGAGLVDMALAQTVQEIAATHVLEPIFTRLPQSPEWVDVADLEAVNRSLERALAFAVGPGLGKHPQTVAFVREFLRSHAGSGLKGVLDADGLNAVADESNWWRHVPKGLVVTPHPGEMARLLHSSVDAVQRDRFASARDAAREWGIVVVLKGAYTIVADPTGELWVNPTGSPNLATGGTGDVLTGVIAGLMAQGLEPRPAAVAGVWLHGAAGTALTGTMGEAGTVASDLLAELPRQRARLQSVPTLGYQEFA